MCWNLAAMSLPSANMGLGWNASRCGRALESRHKISAPFQVKEYPVDILASFHEHFDYVIRVYFLFSQICVHSDINFVHHLRLIPGCPTMDMVAAVMITIMRVQGMF